MLLLLTALALLVIAVEITLVAWPAGAERGPGPLERATMAATVAIALWLGSTWILALMKQLTFATRETHPAN